MDLFRQEVIKYRRGDYLGEMRLEPPRMGWFYFACALTALVAIVLIIALGTFTRSTSVQGRLVPHQGVASIITPASGGTITKIFVAEGQRVRKGDALINISDSQSSVALGDTAEIVSSELADFRPFQGTDELTFSKMEAPAPMVKAMLSLTNHFSLQLASSDFVVDETGEFYFLDLNPGGAFLFVEFHTRYPITAHVAALLGGGAPNEYQGLHAYNEFATAENAIGAV